MPNSLGSQTKTLFLKQESHKLFEEFEVAATRSVKKGQPVILVTGGYIDAAVKAGAAQASVGIAMQDGAAGELVTVMTRGFAITYAEAGTTALVPGPVSLHTTAFNTATGYVEVDDAAIDATTQVGWALDNATNAGDIIRVLWMA